MKGISIDEHKLHEVKMLIEPYTRSTVSYLRYPKHRIHHELTDEQLHLRVPCFLALEMYRIGILPQDKEQSVTIKISGKRTGEYKVADFRYPNSPSYDSEIIHITFHRIGT